MNKNICPLRHNRTYQKKFRNISPRHPLSYLPPTFVLWQLMMLWKRIWKPVYWRAWAVCLSSPGIASWTMLFWKNRNLNLGPLPVISRYLRSRHCSLLFCLRSITRSTTSRYWTWFPISTAIPWRCWSTAAILKHCFHGVFFSQRVNTIRRVCPPQANRLSSTTW